MNQPGSLPTPVPPVNPETQVFWDATAQGRLLLPRCTVCGSVFWYPKTLCSSCGSTTVEWIESSGRGIVYSCTVTRRGVGDYRDAVPYVLAYVELDEGPRVMTNIVDCLPEDVAIGQRVEVVFHDTGAGCSLPRFRPVSQTGSQGLSS